MSAIALRSPDAEGRMFWCINSKLDATALNTAEVAIHRYRDNAYKSFGAALPVCGFNFPQAEIDRLQYLEPNIQATVENCVQASHQRIPAPLLRVLLEKRFDITVLINSRGGGVSVQRMFSQYMNRIAGSEGIETLATSVAASAAHVLFSQGKERLSYPSTQFLLHRPTFVQADFSERAAQLKVPEKDIVAAYEWWVHNEVDPLYDAELASITLPQRQQMTALFEQEKEPVTLERKVKYSGADAPGFITQYLQEDIPLHTQLAQRYGVPVHPAQFHTDPVARFAVLSQIGRRLQRSEVASMGVQVYIEQGKWRIQGDFDNNADGATVLHHVTEAIKEVGAELGIEL